MNFVLQLRAATALTPLSPHVAAIVLRSSDDARSALTSRLDSILNVLYVTAFVLVVILLVVIGFAAYVYRKNRSAKP